MFLQESRRVFASAAWIAVAAWTALAVAESLPGTQPLVLSKDSAEIVQLQLKQVRRYFELRIAAADEARRERWRPDFTSPAAYERSLAGHVSECRAMLGIDGAWEGDSPRLRLPGRPSWKRSPPARVVASIA